jgi:hypothetical protein
MQAHPDPTILADFTIENQFRSKQRHAIRLPNVQNL